MLCAAAAAAAATAAAAAGGATWAEVWTLYERQPELYDSPCSDGLVYSNKTGAMYVHGTQPKALLLDYDMIIRTSLGWRTRPRPLSAKPGRPFCFAPHKPNMLVVQEASSSVAPTDRRPSLVVHVICPKCRYFGHPNGINGTRTNYTILRSMDQGASWSLLSPVVYPGGACWTNAEQTPVIQSALQHASLVNQQLSFGYYVVK